MESRRVYQPTLKIAIPGLSSHLYCAPTSHALPQRPVSTAAHSGTRTLSSGRLVVRGCGPASRASCAPQTPTPSANSKRARVALRERVQVIRPASARPGSCLVIRNHEGERRVVRRVLRSRTRHEKGRTGTAPCQAGHLREKLCPTQPVAVPAGPISVHCVQKTRMPIPFVARGHPPSTIPVFSLDLSYWRPSGNAHLV